MRTGFCGYSGVWKEMMLALDMIERYILALRDGEEQSKHF
jgi:hypothetical protein